MLTLTARTGFDDRVYDDLLDLFARERPADLGRWRAIETERFAAGGSGVFPDRPFRDRVIGFIRDHGRVVDQFAESRAFQAMAGRVLIRVLADQPDLLPPEAAGRVRLTQPRTATDAEFASLLAIYRDAFPEQHARWRDTEISLAKYHEVNEGRAPVPVALGAALNRSLAHAVAFLQEQCWLHNPEAWFWARSNFREIMRAAIPPELMAATQADRELRIDQPSDAEVLAYLDPGRDESDLKHDFVVAVESRNELTALLDMTRDAMEREKTRHWAARRGERSSEAQSRAHRFRIMKRLNEAALALEERLSAERGGKGKLPA